MSFYIYFLCRNLLLPKAEFLERKQKRVIVVEAFHLPYPMGIRTPHAVCPVPSGLRASHRTAEANRRHVVVPGSQ